MPWLCLKDNIYNKFNVVTSAGMFKIGDNIAFLCSDLSHDMLATSGNVLNLIN